MKKAKLFMMLALLVMGVSNVFATTEYYRVVYTGVPTGETGGYYLKTGELQQGNLYNNDPAEGYLRAYRQDGMFSQRNPTRLTNNNVSTYIGPIEIHNYNSNISVSTNTSRVNVNGTNYDMYTITIAYSIKPENERTWIVGNLEYSRYYTESTGNVTLLPNNECAVRLYLGEKNVSVTDTVKSNSGPGTFTSLGSHPDGFGNSNNSTFYKREHKIDLSRATSVTIPATVVNPDDNQTYNVTAIQKWGFCYEQSHQMKIDYNTTYQGCQTDYIWGCVNDHSNRYLRTVRFADPSNVKRIGDYAFMSCTALESIILPNSLEYMGEGLFECCYKLNDCRFQVRDDGTFGVETLKNWTFWMCVSLETLVLPEGFKAIEGRQAGASLQYLLKLKNIRLPNTLETIGAHFLCCAASLQTLTIPASVKHIDAACFHGCHQLREVYMLGPASTLELGDEDSQTFGANKTWCEPEVNNCIFYTTPDYVQGYATDDNNVWQLIADNTDRQGYLLDKDGNRIKDNYGNEVKLSYDDNVNHSNKLYVIPEEKRTFEKGKWVTAIFPGPMIHKIGENVMTGYDVFSEEGSPCRVARMTGATTTTGIDPITKESIRIYSLTFSSVTEDDFEPGVPYMFCPGKTVENYVMIPVDSLVSQTFREDMTNTHDYSVYSNNGPGQIFMNGQYVSYKMHPWDFYFSYEKADGSENSQGAKFYRVPDADNAATAGPTRCYWTINVNGVRSDGLAKPASTRFFDDETTDIDGVKTKVVIEGVYDLNGRKLDIKPEDLPKGMFIINGKKVMMK